MPRKSPVSRDPVVVTGRILSAAQAEFMAHGYEAASTNRITQRFGGSKATLFRYFPTKESLLEAVVRRVAEQWEPAVDWRGIDQPTEEGWLVTFGTRILEWILGDDPIFIGRLAIAEGHKFPRLEHVFDDSAGKPLRSALSRRLRAWTREGRLACRDADADAMLFMDLIVAGAVSRRLYGEGPLTGARLAAHVRRGVALFLNGCRSDREST